MDIDFLNKKEEKSKQVDIRDNLRQCASMEKVKPKKKLFSGKHKNNFVGVNLIHGEFAGISRSKKKGLAEIFFTFIIFGVVIVVVAFFGLRHYENQQSEEISSLDFQIKNIEEEIIKFKDVGEKAIILISKLKVIEGILDYHIHWTKILDFIGDNTLTNIKYSTISGDVKTFKIGIIAPDFESASKQLLAFQNRKSEIDNAYLVRVEAKELKDEIGNITPVVLYELFIQFKSEFFLKNFKK